MRRMTALPRARGAGLKARSEQAAPPRWPVRLTSSGARAARRVVEEFAARGIGDRSLRDMAEAVGTSHRMLLHHFGSRERAAPGDRRGGRAPPETLLRELPAEPGRGGRRHVGRPSPARTPPVRAPVLRVLRPRRAGRAAVRADAARRRRRLAGRRRRGERGTPIPRSCGSGWRSCAACCSTWWPPRTTRASTRPPRRSSNSSGGKPGLTPRLEGRRAVQDPHRHLPHRGWRQRRLPTLADQAVGDGRLGAPRVETVVNDRRSGLPEAPGPSRCAGIAPVWLTPPCKILKRNVSVGAASLRVTACGSRAPRSARRNCTINKSLVTGNTRRVTRHHIRMRSGAWCRQSAGTDPRHGYEQSRWPQRDHARL